ASPAASPAIYSGRCRHPASVFGPCEHRDVRYKWGPEPAANLKFFRNFHFSNK
ncbi:unnamed protein product, partial [Staurois parvus]